MKQAPPTSFRRTFAAYMPGEWGHPGPLYIQQVGRANRTAPHIDFPLCAGEFDRAELRAFASPGPLVFVDAPARVKEMDALRLADVVRALTPRSAPSYFEYMEAAAQPRVDVTREWLNAGGQFTPERYRKD